MITIKKSDMSDLFNYIRWTIDNPSPCMNCYIHGTPECCGCVADREYREKKNSLDGASVYNNMNYQKLADAYGRRYIAEKAKEEAVKEYDRQCKSFDDVKCDYTIVDDRKCGYCKNYKKCNYHYIGCSITWDNPACSDFEPIR